MKTRFPSILGVFAAILMVASFVVPMNIAAPAAVSADPGIMKWDFVMTPGAQEGKGDIVNLHPQDPTAQGALSPASGIYGYSDHGFGNDIIDMAIANDGVTVYIISRSVVNVPAASLVNEGYDALLGPASALIVANILYVTNNSGISSTTAKYNALFGTTGFGLSNAYRVAVAPDDPKFVVLATGYMDAATDVSFALLGPCKLWVSNDGGSNWEKAFDGGSGFVTGSDHIIDVDVSIDYGGKRDIGFVTDTGKFFVRQSSGFSGWVNQSLTGLTPTPGKFYTLKFSPTYNGDSSVALVYTTTAGTFFTVALRDLSSGSNNVVGWAYGTSVEVALVPGTSPVTSQLNKADLQLPSDFSGQSSSLRRAYISLDAHPSATTLNGSKDGIFRVDDTTIYNLMDTSSVIGKSIYSIAYFGTYASGKLLAGERWGYPCSATVPTWFTDSPTTCPIPCWYPALKPTTGAANQGTCTLSAKNGVGAALVGWNVDGSLGLVGTGSFAMTAASWWMAIAGTASVNFDMSLVPPTLIRGPVLYPFGGPWFAPAGFPATSYEKKPIANDESAFAISRNNGETWNQISLIDTTIDWFNDVAVAPDCTTIYLASVNRNTGGPAVCNEFDSVWRSTINPNVAAPLPAVPPLGTYWERVYARVTSGNCGVIQSDLPILRVVPSCTDKADGEIVGWAAQGAAATSGGSSGVMAWSPDYGDYWASVTPRFKVQDFAFESSTTIYVLAVNGLVQRLPYTGTSWSTNLNSYDTVLSNAHTIVAVPDGKVLVGAAVDSNSDMIAAYSADKGVTFGFVNGSQINHGNEHVIFDVDFKNNNFIYVGDDSSRGVGNYLDSGTVYRNTAPSGTRWTDNDMMSSGNGGGYIFGGEGYTDLDWPAASSGNPPHIVGQYGLVQAWTGDPQPALYSAHDNITNTQLRWDSAVCRTLKPRDGMPKPGIRWDCLDIFSPLSQTGVLFTLEPSSLKACGCCTLDTNTTLYAIDDERWAYNGTSWTDLAGRWNKHRYGVSLGATQWDTNYPGYTPKYYQGMLWAYTDCLAKKGPILKSPADKFLVGADPVTGRNQQIDLSWEQLCLSTWYQLQIAKDAAFTMRINPAVNFSKGGYGVISAVTGSILLKMDGTNMTTPAAWIAPGQLPEAGAIYYWRIRSAKSATSQIAASPWSEVRSFTVKAGFIVNTPYYGVQLLAPNNGCLGCKVKPASFSWSPWKEATKYQFDLATDPEFKSLVVTATTTTTGYEYSGTLNYSTNYFWRVKALEVNGLNIPSDWSATFSMQTEPAPAPPAPPPAEPATPVWVWVIIAIGAILVIVTLVLIFKTRRV